MGKGRPSEREILKAKIRKRAQQNQLIHREFGDFAYRALLKKHNDLVERLSKDKPVSVKRMFKLTNAISRAEISGDGRDFLRAALSFWNNELSKKKHNRRPYVLNWNIEPLDKMMK